MSRLQIFWPDDQPQPGCAVDLESAANRGIPDEQAELDLSAESSGAGENPQVLQFEIHARRITANPQYDLTQRARKLHRNNICPSCHSICIVPLEAMSHDPAFADEKPSLATSNSKGTLVAFRCERCDAKWPA